MSKDRFNDLRRQAEKQLVGQERQIESLDRADLAKMAHELAVHQIELEIQNEELRQSRTLAEESRDRYLDLYDFAPVGYFTLDEHSRVVEANLTGCQLLKMERRNLLRKSFNKFIDPEDSDRFYFCRKKVLENSSKQTCALKMQKADGVPFFAQLDSIKVGEGRLRVAVSDISERKQAEELVIKSMDQVKQVKLEWEGTVDSLLQLIFLLDEQGRILRANRTVEAWNLGGIGAVHGMEMHILLHPGCTDQDCYLETLWPQARDKLVLGQSIEREFEDSILGRHLSIQIRPILARKDSLRIKADSFAVAIIWDITRRKRIEGERERLIQELQDAVANIKRLRGLLPICASCKKIRDDKGYWNELEAYILDHSEAEFTHGFCPDCMKKLYGVVLEEDTDSKKQ